MNERNLKKFIKSLIKEVIDEKEVDISDLEKLLSNPDPSRAKDYGSIENYKKMLKNKIDKLKIGGVSSSKDESVPFGYVDMEETIGQLKHSLGEMFGKMNEVDWSRFSDVQTQCISPETMAKKLNDILARSKLAPRERGKRDINFPIVHGKSLKSDDVGNVDVEDFIKKLIKPPTKIFTINEKAKHSETENTLTVNTGIPAFKALFWDSNEKIFKVVSTCPGAGNCVIGCFAMLGNYVRLEGVVMEYARRFQFLMDDPDKYETRAYAELLGFAAQAAGMDKTLEVRWNDAGDFYSAEYFRIAKKVTNDVIALGFKVNSYIYTKVGKIVSLATAAGFVASFSTDSKGAERKNLDPNTTKLAVRVPKILWKGILIKSGPRAFEKDEKGKLKFTDQQKGREELKKIIFNAYHGKYEGAGMTYDSLVFTDELPKSESSEQFKYNVIVLPSGDTDWGAQRRDVKNSYLLEH